MTPTPTYVVTFRCSYYTLVVVVNEIGFEKVDLVYCRSHDEVCLGSPGVL